MSNQPQWPQAIQDIAPQFQEIAKASKLVTWAEESQFAHQALQKNDRLAACGLHTIQNAIINVAAVGLTLNPSLGYAYLVPEKNECALRVSFKGLLKIATDSGSIKWAKAEIVKKNDAFEYRGPCEMPVHTMNPFSDRGETIGVYCIAKTHDGDYLVDVMGIEEINKIQNAAKTDYVWKSWRDEMIKKAIIKRSSKQWPQTDRSDRLNLAIAAVNEIEGSEDLHSKERDITPAKPEPKAKELITADRLETAITKINAGEFTIERLNARFDLTDAQQKQVDDSLVLQEAAQ
jgi:recombination protein RecT